MSATLTIHKGGRLSWHWLLHFKRDTNPGETPDIGVEVRGVAMTEAGARRKARRWLGKLRTREAALHSATTEVIS